MPKKKDKDNNLDALPSGKWRLRLTIEGKSYSHIFELKPTLREVEKVKAAFRQKHEATRTVARDTFTYAFEQYIDERSNTESPATIRGYVSCFRNIPAWFRRLKIPEIEVRQIQRLVNEYAAGRAPKTVANLYHLVIAVIRSERPGYAVSVKLPERAQQEVYIPEQEEVKKILDRLRGSRMELPILLACFGLRRSEICALTVEDLYEDERGYGVHINKGKVVDRDGVWVVKDMPKNQSSVRDVHITNYVADLILKRGSGPVYDGHPEIIGRTLRKTTKELGIEEFNLHKLRHYFASQLHEMGVTDAEAMAAGGWATDNVMKTVYRHANRKRVSEGMAAYADAMDRMTNTENDV